MYGVKILVKLSLLLTVVSVGFAEKEQLTSSSLNINRREYERSRRASSKSSSTDKKEEKKTEKGEYAAKKCIQNGSGPFSCLGKHAPEEAFKVTETVQKDATVNLSCDLYDGKVQAEVTINRDKKKFRTCDEAFTYFKSIKPV